jgi:hypothetical protein
MAIKRQLLNRFYGGYSDDRFLGIPNSFQYAKALEIRKNPNSLTLAYKTEKDSSTTIDSFVKAMVSISTTGDLIAFSSTNGKIWRKPSGSSTYTLVYTDSTARPILNAIEYNNYLYWFTSGHVNRIALSSIDNDWTGTVTENYKVFTNGSTTAHPALEFANKLYIGDGFYLGELDSVGTYTGNKIEIFHDETIIDITYASDYLRMYARKSTKVDDSSVYLWGGTTAAWNQRIIWNNTFIHCAITHEGIDYVIAGKRPFLYKAAGLQYAKEKRLPLIYDNQEAYFSPNGMAIFDGLICFGSVESEVAGKEPSIGRGVWTYGQEDVKYPMSLNYDYPASTDGANDLIGALCVAEGVLYFSWKSGSSYGIDKVNTSKYATTGTIISLVQYSDIASKVKEVKDVDMAFSQLLTGESIVASFRRNLETNFNATQLTAAYSNTVDRNINYKKLSNPSNIGNYNFLETKVVLTAGTSNATTPEVCEVGIAFDDGLEEGNTKQ